jgi:hypothetical protein
VAGSSMLERGGGKAPWWPVATCLREAEEGGGARGGWKQLAIVAVGAGSKWNERGAGRDTKHVKNL